MLTRPPASSIPDGRGRTSSRTARAGCSTSARRRACAAGCSNYFAAPETLLAADPSDGGAPRSRSSGSRCATRSRRCSSSTTSSSGTGPASTSGYKDDKSYPVPRGHPRRGVAAGDGACAAQKRKGVRYFGPYAHAYAIRETLDLLLRTVPDPHLHAIQVRSAPPARPAVPLRAHREVRGAVRRRHRPRGVRRARRRAARVPRRRPRARSSTGSRSRCTRRRDALEFERAARLRDQLLSVRKAVERQQMVAAEGGGPRRHRVRRGSARGVGAGVLRAPAAASSAARVSSSTRWKTSTPRARRQDRSSSSTATRAPTTSRARSSCPTMPEDVELYEEFLGARCAAAKVRVRVPQRGAKRELLATVTHNAQEAFIQHKLRRASDHNARARALTALQEALDLPEAPLRIECFDISNLQGTEIVGVDGGDGGRAAEALRLPALQDPSTRKARTTSRRWRRCSPVASGATSTSATQGARAGKRFSYPPNLLLDRRRQGPARRGRARARGARARGHRGRQPGQAVRGGVPARRSTSRSASRATPRRSTCSSRCATRPTGSRSRTTASCGTKQSIASVLDDVPGLGPVRRSAVCCKEFGSVKRLRGCRPRTTSSRSRGCPTRSDAPCTSASTSQATGPCRRRAMIESG